HQVAGNFAPARQHRGSYSVFTFQPDNAFPFEQLNAARDVVALKKFRHWDREHTTPDAIFSKDQSGLNVLLRKDSRHLHANEPATEEYGLVAAFRARSDFSGVVQRAKIEHVWQIISRTIKLSRPGTRRDEERFKFESFAGSRAQQLFLQIHSLNHGLQLNVYSLPPIPFWIVDQNSRFV